MLTNVLQTAEFNQGQLPSNLAVTGVAGNQNINVTMTTPSFSAASWTFTDWESFDKVGIAGTAGANTITGSSQNDFITGLGGADNMNGAEGGDTYQFLTGDLVSGEVIADTGSSGTDTLKIFADINFTQATTIANIVGVPTWRAQTIARWRRGANPRERRTPTPRARLVP